MAQQTRLRFYSPDSYVFHELTQQFGDPDRHRKSDGLRRLRTGFLEILNYDELALDLAFHRLMGVSNRTSAEQFGIDPSVANRKGRGALLKIQAFGLGIIWVDQFAKHDRAVVLPQFPPKALATGELAFIVPMPGCSKTFRKLPTEKQAETFIRKNRLPLRLEDDSTTEGPQVAIAGWTVNEGIAMHVGLVCGSKHEAEAEASRLRARSIYDFAAGKIVDL